MLSNKEQKFIKSLKVKKYRTRERCFLVEGAKNVQELLNSDFEVELIVGTELYFSSHVRSGNYRNEIVKADLLTQLSTFKTNEDVLAVVRMKEDIREGINYNDHIFVLDGVSDPGNLGTIIRTLDWFGFQQVICSADCAEFYHPKVISSSMGSFTRVGVLTLELSSFYQKNELPVYAATMDGMPVDKADFKSPIVIVMGSESHGISDLTKKFISQSITIPQFGKAESLNVGIATGIIASHLRMA
ncbi:TrmH family RNA methyltransferase [Ekhidna sp.]